MRIIAGRHRSRTILAPRDQETTRPITDRVKENLFNRLVSLGAVPAYDFHHDQGAHAPPDNRDRPEATPAELLADLPPGELPPDALDPDPTDADTDESAAPPPGGVLDLFCGTGSLGLEALSRGNPWALFMDTDRSAMDRLRQNLHDLRELDHATVRTESVFSPLWVRQLDPDSVAAAFVDPPYALADDPEARPRFRELFLALHPKLEPGGLIVYRTPRELHALPMDEPDAEAHGYDGPVTSHYGAMSVHLYQRPLPDDEDDA